MPQNILGSVVRNNDFFGREGIVTQIWDKLAKGSVLLAAPRRFGKTSLMYRLIDNPKPEYKLIHLDAEQFLAALSKSNKVPLSESTSKKILDLIGTPVPYFLQIMFSQIATFFNLEGRKITPAIIEFIYRCRGRSFPDTY
jgi:AAA+ ATPase superfamily predicted ATPase